MKMEKEFVSKAIACVVIVAALFYYNQITTLNGEIVKANKQIEKIAAAQIETAQMAAAQIAAAQTATAQTAAPQTVNLADAAVPLAEPEGKYKDGTYSGTAQGYGGPVTTQIIIESGAIASIEITSADYEDAAWYNMCLGVLDDILEAQSADVDTVSGATLTSKGIIGSAETALSQAVK
jgi:uncharacterized protein with FMN-binding domain